jgi:hypothetical protein
MSASDTICFTCSQSIGEPPRLNLLGNGQVCPTCRDRLLESLPAAMPKPPWEAAEAKPLVAVEGEHAEDDSASPDLWAPGTDDLYPA